MNAFEQSLQNMTNRLQQLTATTEKKVFWEIMFDSLFLPIELANYQDDTSSSLSSVWLWFCQFPFALFSLREIVNIFFSFTGIGNHRNASNHRTVAKAINSSRSDISTHAVDGRAGQCERRQGQWKPDEG